MNDVAQCPVAHDKKPRAHPHNAHWWPDQLNLGLLHQHADAVATRWWRTSTTSRNSSSSTSTRSSPTCTR